MKRDDVILLQGVASGATIKYVQEHGGEIRTVTAMLTPRDWDVTHEATQRLVAEHELGDLTAYPPGCLQWWIDPARNSAVLVAYREPSVAAC